MADFDHEWGSDLRLSPTGGLALAAGNKLGQQRVIRRLMTGELDDLNDPAFGAGLPGYVGMPSYKDKITATVLSQIKREDAVDQTAPVDVVVSEAPGDVVSALIRYAYALGGPSGVELTLPRGN